MESATTAQPSSGHQKRYVPIVAGTLGGFCLALIVGCLFYWFLRKRSPRLGRRDPVRAKVSELQTYGYRPEQGAFGIPASLNTRGSLQRTGHTFSHSPPPRQKRGQIPFRSNFPSRSVRDSGSLFHIGDYTCRDHSSDIAYDTTLSSLYTRPSSAQTMGFCDFLPRQHLYSLSESVPDLETGIPWDWESNLDLSGLGELPFANVDLQTNPISDHQDPVASTVQASSDLEPSRDKGIPLDIGLGHGNSVDGDSDVYLSDSRALPFVNSDLQTHFDFDHQNSSSPNLLAPSDLVPKDDFLAWCNNPSSSSQPGMIPNSPSAPSASNIELPNELTSSPLPTNVEPSLSHPNSQAPKKPESLPLPPAPNLRCQNCPRKFSSRVRLE